MDVVDVFAPVLEGSSSMSLMMVLEGGGITHVADAVRLEGCCVLVNCNAEESVVVGEFEGIDDSVGFFVACAGGGCVDDAVLVQGVFCGGGNAVVFVPGEAVDLEGLA